MAEAVSLPLSFRVSRAHLHVSYASPTHRASLVIVQTLIFMVTVNVVRTEGDEWMVVFLRS